jgi:hypothetical protein
MLLMRHASHEACTMLVHVSASTVACMLNHTMLMFTNGAAADAAPAHDAADEACFS